jgi:pyridoxine/pyridoxamine 5'-phosphate oxidase
MTPTAKRPPFAAGYTAGPDDPFEPGPWSRVEQALRKSRTYWICTTTPNGLPHAMPVWGLWLADCVWFSTGENAVKARNLASKPQCVVHLESGDDVVIIEGVARRVSPTEPDVGRFVDEYDTKYGHRVDVSLPDFALYQVVPRKVYTWQEATFPASNARWYFPEP